MTNIAAEIGWLLITATLELIDEETAGGDGFGDTTPPAATETDLTPDHGDSTPPVDATQTGATE